MLRLKRILSHRNLGFMKFFFTLLTWITISSSCFCMTLSDKLQTAQTGDYIVALLNKNYALISIHSLDKNHLIFEEISVPYSALGRSPNWKDYIKNNAPQATSWILYEISLKTGQMTECYNVLNDSFLDLSSFNSILSKLIYLQLETVPLKDQRRIGISSSLEGFDTRKIWKPKQIFEGEVQKNPEFFVYRTIWPKDDSIISGKTLELYFDAKRNSFPFPFWMQVKDTSDASFKLPIVDGGHSLQSPILEMPRRLPYFYDKVSLDKDEIIVRVQIPHYYTGLKLHAISYVSQKSEPIALKAQVQRNAISENVEFSIPKAEIHENLEKNIPYHFLLMCDSHPNISVESAKSVRFTLGSIAN